MEAKKLLRYSMQLAYLKQLYNKKLINEEEYKKIEKRLMKDYGYYSRLINNQLPVPQENFIYFLG